MGAGASVDQQSIDLLKVEAQKDPTAADVATPRGESAKAEVVRLRALLKERVDAGKESEAAPAEGDAAAAAAAAAPAEGDAAAAAPAEVMLPLHRPKVMPPRRG